MATPVSNPNALKALLILHKAMLAGQVIFGAIAFFLVYSGSFYQGAHQAGEILQVVAIILAAGGFYAGNFLFKRKVTQIREMKAGAKEKFELYRRACMLQWILIEGPCLFVIISFLLTGNYAFLGLAGVLMLLFAMLAPSKVKMVFYLQLSEKEIDEL
ncbi:MAG: hypothetical protein ABI707_13130 [Ferruginibacter sp.]